MKKFYAFLFAAVALVGFAACNSDSTEEPAPKKENVGKMEFKANADFTKTSLDGLSVKWCETDKIWINGEIFTVKSLENDGLTAIFEGNPVEAPYKAVYPSEIRSTPTPEQVGFDLNANVGEGSFADDANIAVAYSEEGTNLSFKNALSVLKFQVAAECETVTINSTNALVGAFTVHCPSADVINIISGNTEITLTGNFKPGVDYYTTVLPGTHELTITTNVETTKPSKTIVKNKIYNLGVLPVEVVPVATEYGVVGSFQGWDVASGKPVTMYTTAEEGWVVAKGIELYKSDEFKIVKGNSWDVSYGLSAAGVLALDKETAVITSNSQNMKAAKNGKFDISFNATAKKIKYTCVEEYTGTVDITINNKANWSPLYITLKDGETVIAENAAVTDNKFAVNMDYIGSSLSYTLSNGSKTMEGNVTIAKDGATINLEETVIKLKVQLTTSNNKTYWGSKMMIHVWNTGTSFDTSWPGTTMTSEGNYTWSIQVPSELVGKTINYLVHNGNGWQSADSKVTISAEGNTVIDTSIGIK